MEDREYINRLVDIYLTDLDSLTHSAGWHGDSIMSKMITYKGFLPAPSGYDQSNITMINEIEFLRKEHALLPLSRSAINTLMKKDREQAIALLVSRFYDGCYLDPTTKTVKTYKDTTRAWLAGLSPKQYKSKLEGAYSQIAYIVEIIQTWRKLAG
jgi:hypothetical protein